MKEIMAIIRMDNMNDTIGALSEAGFAAMTAQKVFGRGKKKIDHELIEIVIKEGINAPVRTVEAISEGHRLMAKRLITLIVPDESVDEVVDIVLEHNKTGYMGDGKIFVLPITEVIRVRTGQTGVNAI